MSVETQNSNPDNNFLKRLLFNLCWWLFVSLVGFIVTYSTDAYVIHISPWYIFFLVTLGPVLLIQSIFYWTIQHHLFPKKNSIVWTLGMNLLVFISVLFLLLIVFLLNAYKLKT